MKKSETKIYWALFAVMATFLAIYVRCQMLDFLSGDYYWFLRLWFEELKENGGLAGLANYPGDYNAPYMTILALLTYLPIEPLYSIKTVSIVFEVVLAVAVGRLIYILKPDKKLAITGYVVTLFLPQIMANGAYWGQCDAIYASFAVLAVGCLFKTRYKTAFVMLGLACAFKLQFIFVLPVFIVKYVLDFSKKDKVRKISLWYFLIIPAVDVIMCLPAILAGKPVLECLMVYFDQTQRYTYAMSMNMVSLWNILEVTPSAWYTAATAIALMTCAGMLLFLVEHKVKLTKERTMELMIWFLVVVTFLLPGMHERYLIVGEMLAITYSLVYRKGWAVTLMINAYAWITYGNCLAQNTAIIRNNVTVVDGVSYQVLALVELAVVAWWTRNMVLEILEREEEICEKTS